MAVFCAVIDCVAYVCEHWLSRRPTVDRVATGVVQDAIVRMLRHRRVPPYRSALLFTSKDRLSWSFRLRSRRAARGDPMTSRRHPGAHECHRHTSSGSGRMKRRHGPHRPASDSARIGRPLLRQIDVLHASINRLMPIK